MWNYNRKASQLAILAGLFFSLELEALEACEKWYARRD